MNNGKNKLLSEKRVATESCLWQFGEWAGKVLAGVGDFSFGSILHSGKLYSS